MRSDDLDPSCPVGRRAMSGRKTRRACAVGGVLALVAGAAVGWAAPAMAGGSVTVSPSTGLANGQTISVTVVVPAATPSDVFVGVTQCGNATSSGTPLTALASDGSDCVGAAGLSSGELAIVGAGGAAVPAGPVAAGTYHVSIKALESGIGTNNTRCIASPPATLPCTVVAATAKVTGPYSAGSGAFQAQTPITYANNTVTTTTTTTLATTTTTTTANGSQSVNVNVGSTTTTTTTAAGAAVASGSSAGSSSSSGAATNSSLAYTGPPKLVWVLGIIGLILLDLGYLSLSATWRSRRARSSSNG